GPMLVLCAGIGAGKAVVSIRRWIGDRAPLLLLAVPFVFHVVSLYRGEIQVFPLSIFGLLNVRYGLAHLPAISIAVPGCVLLFKREYRTRAALGLMVIVAGQYALLMSEGPRQLAVFQEGYRNGVNSRTARELAHLSEFLKANPPAGTVLMNTGALGPAVARGGLTFANIIHEGTTRWHRLDEGIPEDVSTVILQENDPLSRALPQNRRLNDDLSNSFEKIYDEGGISVLSRMPRRK